jgi:beta-galactosidase
VTMPPGRAIGSVTVAVLAAALAATPIPGQGPGGQEPPRVRYTINDGWRYADGPIDGAARPGHEDTGWERVDLPHTWNADAAAAEDPDYRRGVGWYRRSLDLDPSLEGRRIFVRFEGANQVAEVFVNGEPAGRHVGGYTAFAFDITELVRLDGRNVLAVRVDNTHDPDIPPLDADFTFYGGIYRDVWLIATSPVHVTLLDHASPGIFIDTPEVSEEAATVRVRGTLLNATGEPGTVTVVSRIVDPDGTEVATVRSAVEVPAAGEAAFVQHSDAIPGPRLWSPGDPNVYTVITEVRDGEAVVDRVENPLGFRWLRVDPDQGLFLNGEPLRLVGTNRHQDRAGYGNALPDPLHRRDVELVKATGFNFLRLAHYPQDPAVLEAMDRVGLAGWEEIPVVNTITLSDAFADNAERRLREMIRQHYNHPSILFWGYMNEVLLREPDPLPEGYRAAVVELAERLDAVAHEEDATRLTVTAISFGEIDNGTGFQDVPDILGMNLYFGWYYRSLEGIGPFLDSLHARHPDRPLMISEYGAGSDERIHALEPRAFDFSTEYQRRFHESHMAQLQARDYLVGTAVWNQFDFGSASRNDSKPNINQKGLLYYDRTPKDVWHYHRARLLDEPVLHIATRDWRHRAGSRPGDASQPIVVYTNLDSVELSLNGSPAGRTAATGGVARWIVELAPGENRLEARGEGDGTEVRDEARILYQDRSGLFTATGDPGGSAARGIAVNTGSHYQYIDAAGTVWEADRPYEPGGWGYVGGEPRLDHRRIRKTGEDALYQASREGAGSYRFDVVDGEYDVRILLAETRFREPGERVVDVRVNGVPVVTDLDLAARHGPYTAIQRTARVTADDGSGVRIELDASAGVSTVSGIEVRKRRPGPGQGGPETGFLDRTVEVSGLTYPYQVYVPRSYDPATPWPVVLFLHGSGERGDDGLRQTQVGLGSAIRWNPDRYPAIVVMPQSPADSNWHGDPADAALAALDSALLEFSTDPERVYLTGMSRGGNGAWYLAYHHPDRFAAVVPVCGYVVRDGQLAIVPVEGEGSAFERVAARLAHLPIWIWHGDADAVVDVEESRKMAAALRALGADVRYTELEGVGHNAWDPAYGSEELPEWLFAQRRSR